MTGTVTAAPDTVVPIQTGGSQTPFFFLHGQYDGAGFYCYRMAQALGPDRPFYALEPYVFDAGTAPPSLVEIAASHVAALRAVAPQGPYVLGGWCNGALLAYEMARQLEADGQPVEQVVLLDSVYLRYPGWLRAVRGGMRGAGAALRISEGRQLELYLRARHGYRFARHALSYVRSAGYRRTTGSGRLERDDYPGIYDWTAMGYAPADVPAGRITLLWTDSRPSLIHGFRVSRFRRSWRHVEALPSADVVVLPFSHWTALNENLDVLSERLGESLMQPVS